MERSKKMRKILTGFFLAAFLICIGLFGYSVTYAAEDTGFTLNGEFAESYELGDYLEFPAGTFTVGGTQYPAVVILYYPDGSAAAVNSAVFETEGLYRVEYQCVQTGDIEEFSFIVNKNAVSFTSENGLIKSEATYGEDPSAWQTGLTGIDVKLYSGETMQFNRVIDLNDFEPGEGVFKMYVLPQSLGYYEARTLRFRFTDIYDENNYVDVYASAVQVLDPATETQLWKFNSTWLLACANGQAATGIEWGEGNRTHTVHVADMGGYPSPVSPYGYTNKSNTVGKEYLEIGFDLNELTVESTSRLGRNTVVADLDDVSYMYTAWEGFTTGEVMLSVTAREYRDTRVPYEMIFTEIGGYDLGAGAEETEAPVLDVDLGSYTEDTIPQAQTNVPYPVFGFSARDSFTGISESSVKVFYNYNSATRQEYVVTDGCFTPDRTGIYTIEYSATNYFGKTGTALVEVNAVASLGELTISVDADRVTSVSAGEYVSVADYTAGGGSGTAEVIVTAANGEHVAEITDGRFLAAYAGAYEITYTARDYLGRETEFSYTVEVKDDSSPAIEDIGNILPKYFLEGFEYKLPVPAATSYGQGIAENSVTITVKDGNGGSDSGGTHTFVADANGSATITYAAANANGQTEISYTRPVISVHTENGGYDLSKYFYSEELTAEGLNDSIKLSSSSANGNAEAEFVNAVLSDGLTVNFSVDSEMNEFAALNLYITDSENEEISVLLRFVKGAENSETGTLTYNNGKNTMSVQPTFYNGGTLALSYSESTRTVIVISTSAVISETVNGEAFGGFPSGKVYVRFELEGADGEAGINVYRVNQVLSNYTGDSVKPSVEIGGEYELNYELNARIPVFEAIAGDVIDPSPKLAVTVTGPDGTVLTSEDGVRLENYVPDERTYFIGTQYGNYLLTYVATDASGRSGTFYRSVSIEDALAPEIVVNGTISETAKVGDNVAAPLATVTDNFVAAENIVYFRVLELPDFSQVVLSDTADAFNAVRAGVYKLRYFAADQVGNYTMLEYVITVA